MFRQDDNWVIEVSSRSQRRTAVLSSEHEGAWLLAEETHETKPLGDHATVDDGGAGSQGLSG